MKRIKKLIPALLAFLLILNLAACASSSSSTDSAAPASNAPAASAAPSDSAPAVESAGGRSLTLAKLYVQPETAALQKIHIEDPVIAAFPNDNINFEIYTDRQSLQVQVAGGGGPDILDLDGPTDAIEYYKSNRVVALDQYAAQYGWSDTFFEWALGTGYYDGKLISLPNSFEGLLLYVNTDVFSANGWEIPTNEAELVDIMNKAQAADIIPISFGNSNYQGAVDWIYSVFLSGYAGPQALKEALQGERPWSDPLITGSIQQMVDWWKAGYIGANTSQAITMEDASALFADNRAAMRITGTWYVDSLLNTYTDCNWDAVVMPELRSGTGRILPLATGGCYAISANSKDPDFAAEVIDYLFTSVDRHIGGIREANFQPYPIKAITGEAFEGLDPRVVSMYDKLMDAQASGDVGFCAWSFYPSELRIYMNENTDALVLGSLTVEEYISKCQEIVDKAIAEGTAPVLP